MNEGGRENTGGEGEIVGGMEREGGREGGREEEWKRRSKCVQCQ